MDEHSHKDLEDIDFLVKQTMILSEKLKDLTSRDSVPEQNSPFDDNTTQNQKSSFGMNQGPGLLYRIEYGVSTYCIRTFPSNDLTKSYDAISNGDGEILSALRLNENEQMEYIFQVFPTADYHLAEVAHLNFGQRRFPIYEDRLCNLSDPGFSWWLETFKGGMNIFFQARAMGEFESLQKIGPLGDHREMISFFNEFRGQLKTLTSFTELASTDKSIKIVSENNSKNVTWLINLFSRGLYSSHILDSLEDIDVAMMMDSFFREKTTLRKFWIEIQESLDNHLKQLNSL